MWKRRSRLAGAGSGGFYFLAFIGALVYFWQQANEFWDYILAVIKALLWPALLVYEAFEALY